MLFGHAHISKKSDMNRSTFLNLKKATAEEIEKSRCKQYDYVA